MASMNLLQSSAGRPDHELTTIFDKSLLVSTVLIIGSVGMLLGLNMYNASLEAKMTSLNTDITAQLAELEGDSVNRVVDFQERLTNINTKLTATNISPQDMFTDVEKLMVSGASLNAYTYNVEGNVLSMKIASSDFRIVARQVMNFKSFSAFKGVTVNNTSKGNDGIVVSEVVISL